MFRNNFIFMISFKQVLKQMCWTIQTRVNWKNKKKLPFLSYYDSFSTFSVKHSSSLTGVRGVCVLDVRDNSVWDRPQVHTWIFSEQKRTAKIFHIIWRSSLNIKGRHKCSFTAETLRQNANMLRFLILTSLAALGKKMTACVSITDLWLPCSFLKCFLFSHTFAIR